MSLSEPDAGATAVTRNLMTALERHYIAPDADWDGGVFVPEVGKNGAWGNSQRCDAIYVGFTSASGRLFVGHEVKATRSDWLTELKKIGKADAWADQCHEWWLVTVPGVVHAGELPAGWGLLHPGARGRRMKVVQQAARRDVTPSWDAVRSVFSRMTTLRDRDQQLFRLRCRQEEHEHSRESVEREVQARVSRELRDAGDVDALRAEVAAYRGALGGSLIDAPRPSYMRDGHTVQDLEMVGALLGMHRNLRQAADHLVSRYGPLTDLHEQLGDLATKIAEATAAAAAMPAEAATDGPVAS